MKLVREHILFEKFSEEGDPVRDMGIGLPAMIEDYKKKVIKEKGWSGRQTLNDISTAQELLNDMGASWRSKRPSDQEFENYFDMFEYLIKNKNIDVNTPGSYFFGNAVKLKDSDPSRRKRLIALLAQNGLKIKTLQDYLPTSYDDPVAAKEDVKILIFLAEVGLEQRKEKFKQIFVNNVLVWSSENKLCGDLTKWALNKGADASQKNYKSLQNALERDDTELVKLLLPVINKDPKYK